MASAEISQTRKPVAPPPRGLHCPSRPTVYVTRRIPQKGVDTLLKDCDVKQWDSELPVPRGEFLHSVYHADAILCMPHDVIDAQVMDAAGPNLRVIATVSPEIRHVDEAECYRRGIQVIRCPSQPPDNFSELTVALILLTMKETLTAEERLANFEPQTPDLITASNDQITCSWANTRPRLMRRESEERLAYQWSNGKPSNTNCPTWKNIASKTFGIYGLTKIGYGVARILMNLGIEHVLMADCDAELDNSGFINKDESGLDMDIVPFEDFITKADVICVCGSSGKQSQGVFNRQSFKKMSRNAIVITSQSEEQAIDYVDLYEALRDGRIKAAGLNDCNQEPVPFKEPLLGLKNCIFMPQTQESVYDIRHKVSAVIAKNLTDALKERLKADEK